MQPLLKLIYSQFLLILCSTVLVADENTFATDDYVFVRAQVIGCGKQIRLVEVGRVDEQGLVTLFGDIVLDVSTATTAKAADLLTDAWEQRTGHRPETIGIQRVPGEDSKTATRLMMLIYSERKRCERNPGPDPNERLDWQFEGQIANAGSGARFPARSDEAP